MKYYKAPDTEVFAVDDISLLPKETTKDWIEITEAEMLENSAQKTKERFDAKHYVEKRILNYPPIGDYLDGVVKGDQTQIDAYIAACLEVKAQFPKE